MPAGPRWRSDGVGGWKRAACPAVIGLSYQATPPGLTEGAVMLVAVINVNGTVESREIDGSLASMQEIVGGLLVAVSLNEHLTIWVNEEGLGLGLPFNRIATELLVGRWDDVYLVGTALITGGVDAEGETLPIRDQDLAVMMKINELINK